MKLGISATELTEEKETWIATVDWFRYDGGKIGTPGCVSYATNKKDVINNLKSLLEKKGHEVVL